MNQIRVLFEICIVETFESVAYLIECLIAGVYNLGRFIFNRVMDVFDDPFRVLLIVWAVVFLLLMTR